MQQEFISDFLMRDVSLETLLGRLLHPIEQQFVDSILENAELFGMRDEVDATAKSFISQDMQIGREISVLESYNLAYLDWVK